MSSRRYYLFSDIEDCPICLVPLGEKATYNINSDSSRALVLNQCKHAYHQVKPHSQTCLLSGTTQPAVQTCLPSGTTQPAVQTCLPSGTTTQPAVVLLLILQLSILSSFADPNLLQKTDQDPTQKFHKTNNKSNKLNRQVPYRFFLY